MKKGFWKIVVILLSLLIILVLGTLNKMRAEENLVPLEGQQLEDEYGEGFDENSDTVTISKERLLELVNESGSLWELAQRFFDDIILYKNEIGRFDYIPVNKDLAQSDYNWDCLEQLLKSHKEFEYRVGGQTVSIKGIDVSSYQSDIDWKKVADDGVKFAFIRLGYRGYESGELTLDNRFEDNIVGALSNGIRVGVYFVTQAVSVEEAREEAQFVLDAIAPYNVTWPVVLDLESTSGAHPRTEDLLPSQRTNYVIEFCKAVEKKGYTTMLYSNIGWFINQLELERLDEYDKWFAQYFNRPFFPYEFQVWQYTSSGSVAGIKGNVDLNIAMYDYDAGEYVPYKQSLETDAEQSTEQRSE